jgi:hypothetical protein
MATFTVVKPGTAGTVSGADIQGGTLSAGNTPSAAGTLDKFVNDGKTLAFIDAVGATGVYRFLKKKANSDGQKMDRTVTLSSGNKYTIGPFDPEEFNSLGELECKLDSGGTLGTMKVHLISGAG